MALCMKCGAVLNDEDIEKHRKAGCNPDDVPAKGTIKRVLTTDVAVEAI